jgi:uncharacterized protein YjbI with pentapeptide repeats
MVDKMAPGGEPPAEQPKYDQEFFLGLAAKGKDAWNAWRRDPANEDVHVTFTGVDFSETPRDGIDFSGFEFGDGANFSGCKWRTTRKVRSPEFFPPGRAVFNGAVFGYGARFDGAAFGNYPDFTGTVFGDLGTFAGAAFGVFASFSDAAFGFLTRFTGVTFGANASFAHATFREYAGFDSAVFKGSVKFSGKPIEQWSGDFRESNDPHIAELKKSHQRSWQRTGSGPDRFVTVSFERARFDGEADFSGRTFERATNFINARFYCPPAFDAETNAARIDFTGARIGFVHPGKWHWTTDTEVPLRLRAFRKIAEDAKNHDLERDLYIEERKAERGVYWHQLVEELKEAPEKLKKKLEDIDEQQRDVWSNWRHRARARNAHRLGIAVKLGRLIAHVLWIIVMGVYWALADYGRSFARPFAWFIASGFFFYWCYTEVLAQLMAKAPDIDKYRQAVRMVALGNAVPFVGPLTIDSRSKSFYSARAAMLTPSPFRRKAFNSW